MLPSVRPRFGSHIPVLPASTDQLRPRNLSRGRDEGEGVRLQRDKPQVQ